MFCLNCGAQLPDGANFCQKCGKPQTARSDSHSSLQYYFCALEHFSAFGYGKSKWEARIGNSLVAQIIYNVPWTSEGNLDRQKNIELVALLSSQGWEVLTTNQEGYVTAMRRLRQTLGQDREFCEIVWKETPHFDAMAKIMGVKVGHFTAIVDDALGIPITDSAPCVFVGKSSAKRNQKRIQESLDALKDELIKDGWKFLGNQGREYPYYKFSRRVKS